MKKKNIGSLTEEKMSVNWHELTNVLRESRIVEIVELGSSYS
jgi:hypothetical protein